MTYKQRSLAAAICVSLLSLSGCGGSGSPQSDKIDSDGVSNFGGNTGPGYVSFSITDGPVDEANQVVVEFTGVAIKQAGGEVFEFVFDEPKSINLLDLQGSVSESLIENQELPAGEYEWVRLMVNADHDGVLDSFIELVDGSQVELRIPSGAQTGLKLNRGFNVLPGLAANFTIDFDLRKSVVMPKGLKGALLKPSLRIVDNLAAGTLSGSVSSELILQECGEEALSYGAVYVFEGDSVEPMDVQGAETDPTASALVSFDVDHYGYEVGFLPAGSYTVAYTCDAGMDDPEAVDDLNFVGTKSIVIEADAQVILNFDVDATSEESVDDMDTDESDDEASDDDMMDDDTLQDDDEMDDEGVENEEMDDESDAVDTDEEEAAEAETDSSEDMTS